MKTIEVTVAPDGSTRLETRGFVGDECRIASRFLELALGRSTEEMVTAEFHQVQSEQQAQVRQADRR